MAKQNNSSVYTKITIIISILVILILIFLYLGFQSPGFLINGADQNNQNSTEQTSSSDSASIDMTQTPNFDDYKELSVSVLDNTAIVISNNTASNYPIRIYSDFRCPGCQVLESSVYWKYILDLVKSKAFDLTIYPVEIHSGSEKQAGLIEGGAAISIAKNDPANFLRLNSLMMKSAQTITSKDSLSNLLKDNNVAGQVLEDIKSDTYTNSIVKNTDSKINPDFLGNTPQVMINNENVDLQSLIGILQDYINQLKQ